MNKLLELRKKNNETQQDIASFLGVTRQSYNRYECGVRECDYSTLMRLADHFGVSIDYLLGRTDNNAPAATPDTSIINKLNERGITRERLNSLSPEQMDSLLGIIELFLKNLK